MENLNLAPSKFTPDVKFNAETGILELQGSSYPDNSIEFYQPLYDWIDTFIAEENKPLTFNFKITYFNTSSSKCLLKLLEILEKYHNNKGTVEVNWFYKEDDDDIYESGEELFQDLTLTYNLKQY